MQNIVNIRIDDRLIHGQVIAVWLNQLSANRIMVIDDFAANDNFTKSILKLGCPSTTKLSVLSVDRAVTNLNANKYVGDSIFIIVRGPDTLLRMRQSGFVYHEVNIGYMPSAQDKTQVYKQIFCSKKEIAEFLELSDLGIKFTACAVPGEGNIDIIAQMRKIAASYSDF